MTAVILVLSLSDCLSDYSAGVSAGASMASAGASDAAGRVVVAAGVSAGASGAITFSNSLLGAPSLEFLGSVMLEMRQSTTKMTPIVQVAFSRKSVV